MTSVNLYVVLLSEVAVDVLTVELVRAGYRVGPSATSGVLTDPGEVSCIAAYKLEKVIEVPAGGNPQDIVLAHVRELLNKRQILWHAIFVRHEASMTWEPSNIKLPARPPAEPKSALERIADNEDEIG